MVQISRNFDSIFQSEMMNKRLKQAAIAGQEDGTIWAKSYFFDISSKEVVRILADFQDGYR